MNLLVFLDLTYNPGKNFKFYSHQRQNIQVFLIFNYNQGKIVLILPITRGGGTCIPGLNWELLPPLRTAAEDFTRRRRIYIFQK